MGSWDGGSIGRFLRRSLAGVAEVDVVFCPGMGNGKRHAHQAFAFWQQLGIWFRHWNTFGSGGQDFNHYAVESTPRTHPTGLPILDRAKVDELKAIRK